MLTIERQSLVNNKYAVATVVFGIGFIGSIATLQVLHPGSGQLSSGRQAEEITRSDDPSSSKSNSKEEPGKRDSSVSDDKTANSVTQGEGASFSPIPLNQPVSNYSTQSSGTTNDQQPQSGTVYTQPSTTGSTTTPPSSSGEVQVSGEMPSLPSNTEPITSPSLETEVVAQSEPEPTTSEESDQTTESSLTETTLQSLGGVTDGVESAVPSL